MCCAFTDSTGKFALPFLGVELMVFTICGFSAMTDGPASVIVDNVPGQEGTAMSGANSKAGAALADTRVTGERVHMTTARHGRSRNARITAMTNIRVPGPWPTHPHGEIPERVSCAGACSR